MSQTSNPSISQKCIRPGAWSLLQLSYPLMLSNLSSSLMLLCDRFFLAKHSLEAFNALITFSALIMMLQIGINVCACAADVFVGQLNGANKKNEVSSPTWQAIWFSILTTLVFVPLAYYLPEIIPDHLKHKNALFYFQVLIAFSSFSPLICALSTFFVGIKDTSIPLIAAIAGNLTNLVLNIILIFGVEGFIPSLGMRGAAIATLLGEVVSILVLLFAFFSKFNRKTYYTTKINLD